MRAANRLRTGDTIGLFSPSEPIIQDRQERMKPSLALLEQNFRVRWSTHAKTEMFYQAGTREQRLADIQELLEDRGVHALLATWGGKNCNQLVPGLPYAYLSRLRKPVIGFSDTGVILNAISSLAGLMTYYGPNIAGKLADSDHWDLDLLRGETVGPFGSTSVDVWETLRGGRRTGRLFGGNLSTFASGLTGSRAMNRMRDPIFFWESASEPPQIIDQILAGLGNSGFLTRVRAMIVGEVLYEEESRKNRPLNDVLREYGERYDFPVVRIATFGHRKLENPIIPIGARVEVDTSSRSVRLLEGVVR